MKKGAHISSSGSSVPSYLQSLTGLLLLGLVCFLIYNANLRVIGAGDTLPARYLPLILWRDHTLALGAHARLVAHGHSMIPRLNRSTVVEGKVTYLEPWAYWMIRTPQNQLVSLYPVVTPLLVSPLYLPAVFWLDAHDWKQSQVDRVAELMEKVSAAVLASIASVLMLLVLRRDSNRWSLSLALVFAFGTNTWMISSQALWQHGTSELLIALALLFVVIPVSPLRLALLGAVCVLMTANRPPDGLLAVAFLLYVVWSDKRNILWLCVGATLPLAALMYYNLFFIGHIAGGYGLATPSDHFFQPLWSGLAGLLVSPTRGLLIFSPFLVFVPIGLSQRLRTTSSSRLALALSIAVTAQILFYSLGDWRAGASWGPRWLTDILPILIWMLAPAPLTLRPLVRSLLILTMTASVVVQVIGAFWYTKTSDELIFAGNPTSMLGAWNPSNIPFLVELRHSPARGELQCSMRGSIEHVGITQLPITGELPNLKTGTVLKGWALTCDRTPARVLVLIDGIVIGSTKNFLPRKDVSDVLHTNSPSGWRISVDTLGISLGEHLLQLAVRIEPRSDIRIILDQRVFVVAQESPGDATALPQQPTMGTELETMAKRAAQLLQERQAEAGYWLTSYTRDLRYEAPQKEMNTFLTSMLVDLLAPVAHQRGLEAVVERGRQHLVAQIESNGLVRYHGLPNGPTIGKLGCVITPDADDTALVWRIAGPGVNDPRQQLMLAELARYRDVRGLYRTWLAPQAQYQCLNLGHDPDPADVAIQMHVYLMLREFDPSAAQDLCEALKRSFTDEDIWVYYAKAPLVPYLRSAELRRLGCTIPLPIERLALSVAGQEVWSEAVRLFVDTMDATPDEDTRQAIRALLVRLGSDDFALLRSSPPLLYHNDLSAPGKRNYWSEDFGYALWLRLYEAVDKETGNVQQPMP